MDRKFYNLRNRWLFVGLILLIAFSSLILEKYKLVPYIPVVLTVYRGNHILKYDVNLLDSEHKQNIILILRKYGEYYQEKDNVILIRNYLLRDMDLLQNYTNKAEGLREKNAHSAKIRPKTGDGQMPAKNVPSEPK